MANFHDLGATNAESISIFLVERAVFFQKADKLVGQIAEQVNTISQYFDALFVGWVEPFILVH